MSQTTLTLEDRLLIDLEDYVSETQPDFSLVGDSDIERLASVLGQDEQNNIVYAGPTGVGKTATLLGLAQHRRQAAEKPELATAANIPLHMVDRRFLLLDLNALFDNDDPAAINADIQKILEELKRPGNNVLVIEDTNDLLHSVADHQCHGFVSSLMKELKRGEFQAIWMVREEPAKDKLEEVMNCHAEMKQLFTVLKKKEPDKEEILAILKARKPQLEKHYQGLHIDDTAIEECAKLTTSYPTLSIWTRKEPARSIMLLDSAAGQFVAHGQTKPPEIRALEEKLKSTDERIAKGEDLAAQRREIEGELAELTEPWKKQTQALYREMPLIRKYQNKLEDADRKLGKLRDSLRNRLSRHKQEAGETSDVSDFELDQMKTEEMRAIEKEMPAIRAELKKHLDKTTELKTSANRQLSFGRADMQHYFSSVSGIADLNSDESERVLHLEENISKKVYGQAEAVKIIAKTLKAGKAGLKGNKRPLGVFICLGSSGVGKTYTAETTGEALFHKKKSATVFDMSEFMEKHQVSQLIGAPPGYAGYGEGGKLTNAMRENPSQAIVLDEAEKAHKDVFKILLQVFNDGRLSDELGTVSYKDTAFFITTNIGQQLALNGDIDPESPEGREAILVELRKFFPQELLNRVDAFLLFNPLRHEDVIRVVKRDLDDLNKSDALKDKNIRIVLPDADIEQLVRDKYRVEEGARQVQKFLENRMDLADVVLGATKGGVVNARYRPERNGFDIAFIPDGTPVNQNTRPAATPARAFNQA